MKFARASLRKSNFVIIYLKYINCKILFILFSFKKYFINSVSSLKKKKKIRRLNKGLEEKISFPPTLYYSLPFLMFCFMSSSLCWKPCPVLFLSLYSCFTWPLTFLLLCSSVSVFRWEFSDGCCMFFHVNVPPGTRWKRVSGGGELPWKRSLCFFLLNLDIISEIGWNSRKPR